MKKRIRASFTSLSALLALCTLNLHAAGPGVSGGLTLLEAPGARASALGEAYTAMLDDVAAFSYNPSMLRSLKSGQAMFLHQEGLVDDSFSQFMIGAPWRRMGIGLSIGRYDGGDFALNDGVNEERTVSAQRDLVVALGGAKAVGPLQVGVTAKYLSSELIESQRATAFAADFGLSFSLNPRLNFGGAFQNFGTKLKFVNEGDALPRIMRMGASYNLLPKYGTLLLFDVQQLLNESETRPSLGIETRVGPLALRAGYRHGRDVGEFSVGTGFSWNRSALDYGFGLVNNSQAFDSRHRIAYSFRFGGPGGGNQLFVRKSIRETSGRTLAQLPIGAPRLSTMHPPLALAKLPIEAPQAAPALPIIETPRPGLAVKKRVYVVRPGDNLASIARHQYGDHRMWRTIYMANRHLISSPTELEVGQRIALP